MPGGIDKTGSKQNSVSMLNSVQPAIANVTQKPKVQVVNSDLQWTSPLQYCQLMADMLQLSHADFTLFYFIAFYCEILQESPEYEI